MIDALNNLGASVKSLNNGCPPVEVIGRIKGGKTKLDCKSSQYLSSLLIGCPLAENATEIVVENICEKPYIEMTLRWLDERGIRYEREGFERFRISGKQSYKAFEKTIPGDWSSATFIIAGGGMLGRDLFTPLF